MRARGDYRLLIIARLNWKKLVGPVESMISIAPERIPYSKAEYTTLLANMALQEVQIDAVYYTTAWTSGLLSSD